MEVELQVALGHKVQCGYVKFTVRAPDLVTLTLAKFLSDAEEPRSDWKSRNMCPEVTTYQTGPKLVVCWLGQPRVMMKIQDNPTFYARQAFAFMFQDLEEIEIELTVSEQTGKEPSAENKYKLCKDFAFCYNELMGGHFKCEFAQMGPFIAPLIRRLLQLIMQARKHEGVTFILKPHRGMVRRMLYT